MAKTERAPWYALVGNVLTTTLLRAGNKLNGFKQYRYGLCILAVMAGVYTPAALWHNWRRRDRRGLTAHAKEGRRSLQDAPLAHVPAGTARVARAAFPKGTLAMRVRDVLGGRYTPEDTADRFRARGRPAEAPWRLALVTILQVVDGLSDRRAAEAVRRRVDGKYLLGLELTDPGVACSILSAFRARLLEGQAEQRRLDRLLAIVRDQRRLQARGGQRTDATHVLAAVRSRNRLVLVGETLRQALNRLAVADPDGLPAQVPPAWFDRAGPRVEAGRLPVAAAERQALAEASGADGRDLLTAIRAADAPAWRREVPAVSFIAV
jgi:transposase